MQSVRWVGKSVIECNWFFILAMKVSLLGLLPPNVLAQSIPFGTNIPYAAGILPNNQTQAQLNAATAAFYDQWKARYLIPACRPGQYKVTFNSSNFSVSEGHGYGMRIVAFMAGYDPRAQTYFDGMYYYYREHPSVNNPSLMAWKQNGSCVNVEGPDSATDGDEDMAQALLMAHAQWGSAGTINYFQSAVNMINNSLYHRRPNMHPVTRLPLLGDWVSPGDRNRYYSTRPSDFMPTHYGSYYGATLDPAWGDVYSNTIALAAYMQSSFSSAGLVPDFVVNTNTSPQPAPPNFLEGPNDGGYGYNSCRVPWRIAEAYLAYGDTDAQAIVSQMNQFFRSTTGNNPSRIRDGYNLNGTVRAGTSYSLAFSAPLLVAAMVDDSGDPAAQDWLNRLWADVQGRSINTGGYYENTLKLQGMITASGNWWAP